MNYKIEEIVEKEDGIKLVCLANLNCGHRCGYIGIPMGKKYSKVEDYDNFPFEVHGGWTFSGISGTKKEKYPIETSKQYRWFGFDCGHLYDKRDLKIMHKSLSDFYRRNPDLNDDEQGIIRTTYYVMTELETVYNQMKARQKNGRNNGISQK